MEIDIISANWHKQGDNKQPLKESRWDIFLRRCHSPNYFNYRTLKRKTQRNDPQRKEPSRSSDQILNQLSLTLLQDLISFCDIEWKWTWWKIGVVIRSKKFNRTFGCEQIPRCWFLFIRKIWFRTCSRTHTHTWME